MSWAHMTDKELAEDIRSRVAELNEMAAEAATRDIIADFEVFNAYTQVADNAPHKVLSVTTSQRI